MSEVGSNSSAEEISPEEIEEIQIKEVGLNFVKLFIDLTLFVDVLLPEESKGPFR